MTSRLLLRAVLFSLAGVAVCSFADSPKLLFDDAEPGRNIPLAEYQAVMPSEAFKKLVALYRRTDMMPIDKAKEIDDVFMSLEDEVLEKLPLPKAFRKFPEWAQKRVRAIYYNKSLPFEAKMDALDQFIAELPEEILKLLPTPPPERFDEVPDELEYQVSVVIQFNGLIATEALRNYLTPEMYDYMLILVREKSLTASARAALIGRLLKEAYGENPDEFPLIDYRHTNESMPLALQKAGLHLIFGKNPLDTRGPLGELIAEYKSLVNKNRLSTNSTTVGSTASPSLPSAARPLRKLERFARRKGGLGWNVVERTVQQLGLRVSL